ncbi:hypothetical protein T4B_5510, partial [Trichinella pseudospiralis]
LAIPSNQRMVVSLWYRNYCSKAFSLFHPQLYAADSSGFHTACRLISVIISTVSQLHMLRSKIPVREISGESVDSLHHRSHPPVLRRLFVFNIINQGGKQWQPAADSVGTAEILTLSPIDERFNTRYS